MGALVAYALDSQPWDEGGEVGILSKVRAWFVSLVSLQDFKKDIYISPKAKISFSSLTVLGVTSPSL